MVACPYCKHEMGEATDSFGLTRKQRMVFEAVLATGPLGIEREDLRLRFFTGLSPTTMRTRVYQINRIIKPLRIKSKDKTYYVAD